MYVSIAEAGRGAHADAFFSLSQEAVVATKHDNSNQSLRDSTSLMSGLVVVKECRFHGHESIGTEIAALELIRQQQNSTGELPFFNLTAWDTENLIPRWLATSTLPLCCDLGSLKGRYKYMPEEFLWLIFVQLHQALKFLHATCEIAHGDLHPANIVVGYPTSNDRGLPQVKVIDLGSRKPLFPRSQQPGFVRKIRVCYWITWTRRSQSPAFARQTRLCYYRTWTTSPMTAIIAMELT
jgi:serine/threonine protein kinase